MLIASELFFMIEPLRAINGFQYTLSVEFYASFSYYLTLSQ